MHFPRAILARALAQLFIYSFNKFTVISFICIQDRDTKVKAVDIFTRNCTYYVIMMHGDAQIEIKLGRTKLRYKN